MAGSTCLLGFVEFFYQITVKPILFHVIISASVLFILFFFVFENIP